MTSEQLNLPVKIALLKDALEKDFRAEVNVERIMPSSRYRFDLVSPLFEGVPQMERQDRVWQTVDRVLGRDAHLQLTLVLAYALSDLDPTH